MPDGPLCAACYAKAKRRQGACAICATTRLLPGVDATGRPTCCSCAGIRDDYSCSRCGIEWALRTGICEWCWLADDLDSLLAGPVDLSLLRERLLSAPRPDSIIIWLYSPTVRALLRDLAGGTIAVSHQALDVFTPRRSADHLRELLVSVAILPTRDELLVRFDRLVLDHIDKQAATKSDREILAQFARWGLRPQLVAKAQSAPLRDAQINNATQRLRVATALLAWLDHHRHHDLSHIEQADIDEWFTTPPSTRTHAAGFLRWAIKSGHCQSNVRVPKEVRGGGQVIDQTHRLDLLRRLLDPDIGSLQHRVAGVLLVLFGQPYDRIAALPLKALGTDDNGRLGIHLGQGTAPIPPPFDAMFTELAEHRPNLNTATQLDSLWLFPGRLADCHVGPATLRMGGIRMGIDLTPAKRGALRQLVIDCPPPVVADMLGYSYQTLDGHAQAAGSPYRSYAARRAIHQQSQQTSDSQ
jgi:hypothetical protein